MHPSCCRQNYPPIQAEPPGEIIGDLANDASLPLVVKGQFRSTRSEYDDLYLGLLDDEEDKVGRMRCSLFWIRC